jgi:hypothetical protein
LGVRGDLILLETAVRRRWDIDCEAAARTINESLNDPDPRVALRAAGIAALMESQNQKDEHKELDEFSNRVLELANRLGVDVSSFRIGEATEERASQDDGRTSSRPG